MSCPSCVDYKPGWGHKSFTCLVCRSKWVLAGVCPGTYWEPLERAESEMDKAMKVAEESGCSPEQMHALRGNL